MQTMKSFAAAVAAAIVVACGDGTGPVSTLAVQFRADAGASAAAHVVAGPQFALAGSADAQQVEIPGSNGTLEITAITLLLSELELDPVENGDCDADGEQCEEIEVGPFAAEVSLTGEPVTVASEAIEPGIYEEVEFEVEDLDADEGEDPSALEQLLEQVRLQFDDWPTNASMVVEGTFHPADGSTSRDFRVYFRAELEIELDFDPPREITDAGETITVELHLADWFRRPDGTVVDLSQFDFSTTSEVVEFELEIENGVSVEDD